MVKQFHHLHKKKRLTPSKKKSEKKVQMGMLAQISIVRVSHPPGFNTGEEPSAQGRQGQMQIKLEKIYMDVEAVLIYKGWARAYLGPGTNAL